MSSYAKLFTAVVLLCVAFFEANILEAIKNIDITPETPEEVVVVNITPPSEANKVLTETIQRFEIEVKDAKEISDFYGQLADVIRDDAVDQIIVQNKPFRDWYIKSGSLNFTPSLKGKYIGLGSAIDAVLMGTLGDQDIKWTPQMRKNAAEICDAIAWAVHQ